MTHKVYGTSQQMLIKLYHDHILECNKTIVNLKEIEENLEAYKAKDARYRNYTPERIKEEIDSMFLVRKGYIHKFRDARSGIIRD